MQQVIEVKRYHRNQNPNGTWGRCSGRKVCDFKVGDRVILTIPPNWILNGYELIGAKGVVVDKIQAPTTCNDGQGGVFIEWDHYYQGLNTETAYLPMRLEFTKYWPIGFV